MNTKRIFDSIAKHVSISNEEKETIRAVLTEEHALNRNDLLQRQGEPCKYFYFVNSGILRAYYLSTMGKDSTVMFATEDWWITDMYCFLNELPSMVNIQALEASNVLRVSKHQLEGLYQQIPQLNSYFRILIQNAYCREQLRTMQNLSLPAKERYEGFIQKYPKVASKVTLKQIASYLGITPEFLSAIRAQKNTD